MSKSFKQVTCTFFFSNVPSVDLTWLLQFSCFRNLCCWGCVSTGGKPGRLPSNSLPRVRLLRFLLHFHPFYFGYTQVCFGLRNWNENTQIQNESTQRVWIQNTPGKVLVLSQHWSSRVLHYSQKSPKYEGESVIPAGTDFTQAHPHSHSLIPTP